MEAETRKVMARLNPHFRRFKEPVKALSGGQRQSVAIARAIYFNARVLIMDEPTAALGPAETKQVADLVLQLKKEGIGIFLISHDIHDVFGLADRVSVMKNGKLVGIRERVRRHAGRGARHDHPGQVPARRDAGAGRELTPGRRIPLIVPRRTRFRPTTHPMPQPRARPMTQTIYGSLKGKTVLITGGASGIGASIAEAFHAQGAKVGDARFRRGGRAGAWRSVSARRLRFEQADVRDIPGLQAAIRRVSEALGPITVLVNNAARDDRHTIDQVTPEYWRERFATNLDHQFFAAQAVLPDMDRAGGGSIVNMGSTSYMVSDDSFAAYKTAKSAVVGLTRALARELGARNIRVNCVVARLDHDPAPDRPLAQPRSEAELMRRQCVKRRLVPEDIANARPLPGLRRFQRHVGRRAIWWTAAGSRAIAPCAAVRRCAARSGARVLARSSSRSVWYPGAPRGTGSRAGCRWRRSR